MSKFDFCFFFFFFFYKYFGIGAGSVTVNSPDELQKFTVKFKKLRNYTPKLKNKREFNYFRVKLYKFWLDKTLS